MTRRIAGAAVAAALLAAGCAEYDQTTESDYETQAPAAAGATGTAGTAPRQPGSGDMPRPSTGAARRAAHNTVDRINEHQREIEKAIEND